MSPARPRLPRPPRTVRGSFDTARAWAAHYGSPAVRPLRHGSVGAKPTARSAAAGIPSARRCWPAVTSRRPTHSTVAHELLHLLLGRLDLLELEERLRFA
jgi:hypothetical protein